MNRSAVRLLIGIVVVLVLVTAAGGAFFWWKVAALKDLLVADLEKSLGAKVEVSSLDLDVWKGELHAAGISLTNERPSAPWEKGEISQATVHFHLADVFASTLPLTVDVSSWNVVLRPYAAGTPAQPDEPDSASASPSKGRFQVIGLSAHEGTVEVLLSESAKVDVQGVAFQSSDNGGGAWITKLQAASVEAGSLEAGASSVEIRGERDKITFSNLRMQCGQGLLSGDGEVELGSPHPARIDLKAVDVPVTMLVAVEWQMKLSGAASGTLHYEGTDAGGSAKGQIDVGQGKFNVLPWLGKVTTLVGLPDISNLEVDKATTDFEWKDHTLHLTNLDVRKNDVIRIAGEVAIDPKGQVDGQLKLGLPATVTAKWPELQDKIFPVQLEDYAWADVHLTGTPDHLEEDLTPRLLAFGLGQGGDLLNQTSQKAMDLFKNLLGK